MGLVNQRKGTPCVCSVYRGTSANQTCHVTSSLTPGFHQELLTREQTFLYVALDFYIQLLQLFVEGKDLPQPDQAGQSPDPTEHVSEAQSLFFVLKKRAMDPTLTPSPATCSIPLVPTFLYKAEGACAAALAGRQLAQALGIKEADALLLPKTALLLQDLRVALLICLTCEQPLGVAYWFLF